MGEAMKKATLRVEVRGSGEDGNEIPFSSSHPGSFQGAHSHSS